MFERFSQAGLPAEQAVAAQPKTVLLAVGTEALLPLAVAICLVGGAYWYFARQIPPLPLAVSIAAGAILYYLVVVDFSVKVDILLWIALASVAVSGCWAAVDHRADTVHRRSGQPRNRDVTRLVTLAVATGVLGCLIGLIRTVDAPKLRGAAVALAKGRVVSGVFVAQTSDQIFIGQVVLAGPRGDATKAYSGAIVAVNRREVLSLALGTNTGLRAALREGELMASALREEPAGDTVARHLAEA